MAETKLMTMRDAVARHVPSGSVVLLGAQLEQMIPFAAGHELIRQERRDLTLVGPISDILFDQMIGAGCVSRVMAAWVGNVSAGVGYCFRRAVEQAVPRKIEVVDYSNFTMALALHAAALGVPFLPTYATLGSDLLKKNGNLREFSSPVSEEKLVAVRALRPDVAILHVQRADAQGNAHIWGSLGVAVDGGRAARKIIIVAEEIVEPSVISSDPNRTLVPGFLVEAVVHEPGGAHPSPVQGYYGRDHAFFARYHEQTRRAEDFEDWLARWVMRVSDRSEYLKQIGEAQMQSLGVKDHAYTVPADFGY
ncbi:MAG TPA: CoA-transferase [Candidatus Acidoferrales bacterium]|jgi:glutaconate CoA-transferase subunit A|nr:CoA-transferase [Candidatus Acidoferrales bacterium]